MIKVKKISAEQTIDELATLGITDCEIRGNDFDRIRVLVWSSRRWRYEVELHLVVDSERSDTRVFVWTLYSGVTRIHHGDWTGLVVILLRPE
jgi:hypothetical protein